MASLIPNAQLFSSKCYAGLSLSLSCISLRLKLKRCSRRLRRPAVLSKFQGIDINKSHFGGYTAMRQKRFSCELRPALAQRIVYCYDDELHSRGVGETLKGET